MRPLKIIFWRTCAVSALLLGLIGVLLPVMPTVPFVILAAWAASKGWPQLEKWLLDHHLSGPHIRRWRANGSVPRRAKVIATVMMSCSAIMLWFLPLPDWLRWAPVIVPAIFALVLLWLWRRPEH